MKLLRCNDCGYEFQSTGIIKCPRCGSTNVMVVKEAIPQTA